MIYGVNFNGSQIPEGIKRMFAESRRISVGAMCGHYTLLDRGKLLAPCTQCGNELKYFNQYRPKGESGMARLQGVAQSEQERDAMLEQANNGRRMVFSWAKQTAAGVWYGIYCY